ncbi:MAG: hypothetical protein HY321_13305 [Armatimonadetes bacterium]|nr:hypothetical protein [Armatimonadota bacterium]
MPTTSKWPKPRSEDEFEDMAVDFLRIRWKDPYATRNGRRGQRQDGVDIVGHPPWLEAKAAGAQCKNTESLTLAKVTAEVERARSFAGGLGEFLLVTAADRDVALQAEVREHFTKHRVPFHVEVIFWPDIVSDLSSDEQLVAKHWKGFPSGSTTSLAVPQQAPPEWIGRDGVGDKETFECQLELLLSVSASGVDLEAGELAVELYGIAPELGDWDGYIRTLLAQEPPPVGQAMRWEYRSRSYANVIQKWELVVADGGAMVLRWAEFNDHYRSINLRLQIRSVLALIWVHRVAVGRAAQRVGIEEPATIALRLAAHGSGPLHLCDDVPPVTEVTPRPTDPRTVWLPLPELAVSEADWSVQVQADWSSSLATLTGRLLSRALSHFRAGAALVRPNSKLREILAAAEREIVRG